jgi:hypothetical protein
MRTIAARFVLSIFLWLPLNNHALELRYGKGDFKVNGNIDPLFSASMNFDIETWTLAEPHLNILKSPVYISMRFDYFSSDFVNQVTDFASLPLTTPLPVVGQSVDDLIDQYTDFPVPADYRIHGTNLDIALGYDVWRNEQGYLGLAINTGFSMPYMETRHLTSDANLVMDLMDTFETRMRTWKFGPKVQLGFQPRDWLELRADFTWNYQTGKLETDILGSNLTVDGQYRSLDIQGVLFPTKWWPRIDWLKQLNISAGYHYSKWDHDQTRVNLPVGGFTIPRMLDMDFSHVNLYFGVGYRF